MPLGYMKSGKPDTGWWVPQIVAGREFRKKWAHEDRWDDWRSYYRGNWRSGVLPINLFFSFMRSMIPRVYFKNPAVSITPAMPGFLEMAFAQVTDRVTNKMLSQMEVKNEIKMMVQDAWLFGTTIGKLGFGGQFAPTPNMRGGSDAPVNKSGHRVEYDQTVRGNMPWFMRVPTGHFIVPDGSMQYRGVRWVAHDMQRAKEDVEADERFIKSARENVPITKVEGSGDNLNPVDMVDLTEIHDAKTGEVILLAPYGDDHAGGQVLFHDTDRFLMESGRFPFFVIQFNPDDEVFWAIPDAKILEPHQLEANEIRTQMMKHRRLAIIKLLVKSGTISEEEKEKMLTEDVSTIIEVDGVPGQVIEKMQVANIPSDLAMMERELMQDVRETLGFSRNQMGELQSRRGDTSATEAAIVDQSAEIRIDERRDLVAEMIVKIVKTMNPILFDRWDGQQVAEVVGPGGAEVWVKFDPSTLAMGHYNIRVDPDSSRPRSRQSREQKALAVYNVLKMNPLVDPEKLTRYLMTEIEGVQMDDLMRALPAPSESSVANPMSLGGLAGLLQDRVGAAQKGNAPPQIRG